MIDKRTLDELLWICDFNGYELGFPEVDVVSVYNYKGLDIIINPNDSRILKIIIEEDD